MAKHAAQPIRVLLLLHELSQSGAPKVALDVFEALGDAVDVRVWSLNGGPLEERARKRGQTRVLQHRPLPLGLLPAGAAFRINGRVQSVLPTCDFAPDVLYANSIVALNWTRYTRLPRAPILLHVHEAGSAIDRYSERFEDTWREVPQRFIAVSNAVRDDLVARNIAPEKITVAHPFISLEIFDVQAKQQTQALDRATDNRFTNHRFVVGGAGRISWTKGPELWLLMAAELTRLLGRNAVRFVWIGVGETEDDRRFRVMAHKLGLDDVLECVPPTPQPFAQFARFDAFALTSWEDACPLVVLEAMALEKPAACFAGGGGADRHPERDRQRLSPVLLRLAALRRGRRVVHRRDTQRQPGGDVSGLCDARADDAALLHRR